MATVRIDRAALDRAVRGPDSPVRRRLRVDGERIRQGARNACPRSVGGREHVQDAIVVREQDRGQNPGVVVGTFLPAGRIGRAYFLHQGTVPHKITASRAGALSFYWPTVGAMTIVPRRGAAYTGYRGDGTFIIGKGYVDHPGTRPRPFLLDGARAAGFPV